MIIASIICEILETSENTDLDRGDFMISLYYRRRWFIFRATRVFLFMLLITLHFGTYNHISADTDFDDLNQTISSKITKQNALNNPDNSHDENSRQVGAYYHRSNAKFRVGIEEEEAMVFESLCFSASSALKSSIRFTAIAIRRTGDTIAGVLSVTLKTVAGAFKLSADAFWITAMQLAQPRAPDDRMPHLFDHAGRRVAKVLRTVANVFYGLSEASIMAGEATQALAIGLGQAVEDSFSSLEFLCSSLQRSFTFLLRTEENKFNVKEDSFHQQKRRAILHTEVSQKHQTMPLKFGKPVHLSSSDLRSFSSRNKQTNLTDSTESLTRFSSESNIDISDAPTGTINSHSHSDTNSGSGSDSGSVGLDIDDDIDDDYLNTKSAHPSSLPPYWTFFAHAQNNQNNSQNVEHSHKSDNSFDIKSKLSTITGYFKRACGQPPSDIMEYFDSIPSVFLLLFHVFRSWITGPWTYQIPGFLGIFSSSSSSSEIHTHDDRDPGPSKLGPQLFFSLLLITILSNLKFRSIIWKTAFMICLITVVWMTLMASDHVNRKILATKVSIKSVDSLMRKRVMMSAISPLLSIPIQKPPTPSTPMNAHENASKSVPNNNGNTNTKKSEYNKNQNTENLNSNNNNVNEGIKKSDDGKNNNDNKHDNKNSKNSRNDRNKDKDSSNNNDSSNTLDFEEAVWVNVMMASVWNVERTGGLGPYISRTIQGLVNDELALVPPGIANIQLKRLTLGTQPPVVQAINMRARRASICITPAEESTHKVPTRPTDKHDTSTKSVESDSIPESRTVDKGVRAAVASTNSVQTGLVPGTVYANTDTHTDRGRDSEGSRNSDRDGDGDLGLENRRSSKSMEWSQWEEWQMEWDKRHVGHPSATSTSSSTTSSSSAQSPPMQQRTWSHRTATGTGAGAGAGSKGGRAPGIPRRPGGGSGCERLVVDLDVTYVSRDMDIVLTLRSSDVRSVLPEATVTLSGVVLSGVLRVDGELTPNYPFVGNATVRTYVRSFNFLERL